jgi:hypothetical protein
MKFFRPGTWLGVLLAVASVGSTSLAQGEKLAGIVGSVDLEGRRIVVKPAEPDGTDREPGKTVDVQVSDQTVIRTTEGKSFPLKELKAGDGVGLVVSGGVASAIQVRIKPDELTGHVKAVKPDTNEFVVTKTGTTIDATVAINAETRIVSVTGQKLELKDLKKGDGVGISHTSSLASKILVNAKND